MDRQLDDPGHEEATTGNADDRAKQRARIRLVMKLIAFLLDGVGVGLVIETSSADEQATTDSGAHDAKSRQDQPEAIVVPALLLLLAQRSRMSLCGAHRNVSAIRGGHD